MMTITKLHNFDPPQPRPWLVEGLLPKDAMALLIGNGGTGKSYLALALGIHIALGRPFLGRPVRRTRTLFLDAELDLDEAKRRTAAILKGMGLSPDDDRLDGWLYYARLEGALDNDRVMEEVWHMLTNYKIGFTILDSLTMSSGNMDVNASNRVVPLMTGIQQLRGTTLIVDHVTKSAAMGASPVTPYGSVFKHNAVRQIWSIRPAGDGVFMLRSEKSNFSVSQRRIAYAMSIESSPPIVRFQARRMPDESSAMMRSEDWTMRAILELTQGQTPVTVEAIHQWRLQQSQPVSIPTVRNHLTALRKSGHLQFVKGGVLATENGVDEFDTLDDELHDADADDEMGMDEDERWHGEESPLDGGDAPFSAGDPGDGTDSGEETEEYEDTRYRRVFASEAPVVIPTPKRVGQEESGIRW